MSYELSCFAHAPNHGHNSSFPIVPRRKLTGEYTRKSTHVILAQEMRRNAERGNVRRVRDVAGKTTTEEKTVEKSAETRKRRWPSTKSDDDEQDALG
jgi:hypothetical protein